jgi:enoyl-CoA hydratase
MHRVPIPIIGAVKGHVITGGFELALACDILVGSSSTVFRDTHVKFGLAPCWGLSQKLQRRIGPGRAKLVSFSARPINASLAYEWGLLDEIVPSADNNHEKEKQQGEDDTSLLFRAIEIADMIGSQNQTMVRRYKKALEEGGSMDLHKGLQRERELGLAHYVQAINDGMTFESAKAYIEDTNRPRYHSKL